MGLLSELKRRNVFRVGIAYLLFAWIVVQVTSTVAPILQLPDWTLAFVLWIGVVGLPFVLIFAWAFELTPEGIKREKDVDRSQSITTTTAQKINHAVIGLLAVAVIFLMVDNYVLDDEQEAAPVTDTSAGDVVDHSEGYDSIGVLPFVNMSNDPNQEYFSDGISEELLNALAKLKNLQVAARTSSFAFKGQNHDIMDIGQQLNVDTVLEGSVRKSGTRVRITAQLIDVNDGYHLWSETYDRELTDIFAVQDEITASIVKALVLHFDTGDEADAAKVTATNMSAYDAYLQGLHQLRSASTDSSRAALRSFRAATEADPEFAAAWAARATAVLALRQTNFREGIPAEEAFLLARSSIDRALAIDPMLAEAYVAEGLLFSESYRYEEALISLEKAVKINPNLAEAWTWLSRLLGRFGRIEEARESMRTALELDPHNQMTAILAANLADDFYDLEFADYVARFGSQFARVRQLIEVARLVELDRLSKEDYERITSIPELGLDLLSGIRRSALKELDVEDLIQQRRNGIEFLMWLYMTTDQWDKAQAIFDELSPARQQAVLNLEEMSVMQASQGLCEDALATMDAAHGGEIRIHGEVAPNVGRSNSNLALNRVYCLRKAGRSTEAEPILAQLRNYIDTLRNNIVYGKYVVDAKLRVLDGDIDGALGVLEAAKARNELHWDTRYDPILRTLDAEPRFIELFAQLDREIDELRAELGLQPAQL